MIEAHGLVPHGAHTAGARRALYPASLRDSVGEMPQGLHLCVHQAAGGKIGLLDII